MSGLASAGYFLLSVVFNLVIFVLWARMFIRYFTVSPFLPFSQSIYQLTNPVVGPIQKALFSGPLAKGPYDLACFVLLVVCELLKFTLFNFLFFKTALPVIYIVWYTLADLIAQPCLILFYAIIIRTLMSWFVPSGQSPIFHVLYAVTEPLLRTIRRLLPPFGMLDLSPILALVMLKVIEILVMSALPFTLL
jgi:YggT family protein